MNDIDNDEYIKPLDRPTISHKEFDEMCDGYRSEIKELKEAVYVRDCYIKTLKQSIIHIGKVVNSYSFTKETGL